MAIEEHGGGKQLVRIRLWPRFAPPGLALTSLSVLLIIAAVITQAWLAAAAFGVVTALLAFRALGDCAAATASYIQALKEPEMGGA
jgi:hypothetical protein